MEGYSIFQLGDQAVTISLSNKIRALDNQKVQSIKIWIEKNPFPGLLDIITSYSALTLNYDAFQLKNFLLGKPAFEFVQEQLVAAYEQPDIIREERIKTWRIPVCYETPFSADLEYLCDLKKMTKESIIRLHVGKTYIVYMIGFLPGFPYLAEVDEQIAVARKEKPRTLVPAGSVGIAGVQTGIYPMNSPGGWQLIGRTPFSLFNKNDNPPVQLAPGDRVNFYEITKDEFDSFTAKGL